jgi:hypothetical protein
MTDREFQFNMRAADTFRRLSPEPYELEYWAGYLRGLRRLYHGEKFGASEEHALWLAAADEARDHTRHMRGLGYRAGFEGWNIQEAMKYLAIQQYRSELGRMGGSARSERKTTAVRENAKRGGRPRSNELSENHRSNRRIRAVESFSNAADCNSMIEQQKK